MKTLVTFDADYLLQPTPQQIVVSDNARPHLTHEALVYDYGATLGKRPPIKPHHITMQPQELITFLKERNIPPDAAFRRTVSHGDMINELGLEGTGIERIVCFDAHLDCF
jgi:hypothetical protein